MLLKHSQSIPETFPKCSQNIPKVFLECSWNIPEVFLEYTLNNPERFSKLSQAFPECSRTFRKHSIAGQTGLTDSELRYLRTLGPFLAAKRRSRRIKPDKRSWE